MKMVKIKRYESRAGWNRLTDLMFWILYSHFWLTPLHHYFFFSHSWTVLHPFTLDIICYTFSLGGRNVNFFDNNNWSNKQKSLICLLNKYYQSRHALIYTEITKTISLIFCLVLSLNSVKQYWQCFWISDTDVSSFKVEFSNSGKEYWFDKYNLRPIPKYLVFIINFSQ